MLVKCFLTSFKNWNGRLTYTRTGAMEYNGRSGLSSESDTSVNTQTSLKKKKTGHKKNNKKLHKCKNCHLSFLTLTGLLIHTKTCEEVSSDQNSSSESESRYPIAKEEEQSKDDDIYSLEEIKCQYCNRSFTSRKGIAVHRRACNAESVRRKKLDKIKSNLDKTDFTIQCQRCSRVFTSRVGIAVHRRYCNSSTKYAKTHSRKLGLQRGEKEKGNSDSFVKCPRCECTFTSRKGLSVHGRMRHSVFSKKRKRDRLRKLERNYEAKLERKNKASEVIKCQFCARKFASKKGLAVHRRVCNAESLKSNQSIHRRVFNAESLKSNQSIHRRVCNAESLKSNQSIHRRVCNAESLKSNQSIHRRVCNAESLKSNQSKQTSDVQDKEKSRELAVKNILLANKIRMKYLRKGPGGDSLKCQSCSRTFQSRKGLTAHSLKCVNETLTLESSESDDGTANESNDELTSDQNNDASKTKIVFKCPNGKRRFKSKVGLGVHLRRCDERFPCESDSDFDSENESIEPRKKLEKKILSKKCPHCKRIFLSKQGLRHHIRTTCEVAISVNTSPSTDPENNKSYKCQLCKITLGRKILYLQHLKGHKKDCRVVLEDCLRTQHTKDKSKKETRAVPTNSLVNMEQQPIEKQQNHIEDLVNKKIAKQLVNLWAPDELFSRHHFHVKIPTALEQYESNESLEVAVTASNLVVPGYSHVCPTNPVAEYEDISNIQVLDTKSFIGELLSCSNDELYEELCDRSSLYRCVCGMYTRDQAMYNLHASFHAKGGKSCSLCNFKANDWQDIYVHISDHKK